jgi:hypothetical protein
MSLYQVKVKLSCYHHAGDNGERIYSCYLCLTSALGGVSGQYHAPSTLYPWYLLRRRLGGPLCWSEHRG